MAIARDHGLISFICDACGNVNETQKSDFSTAWAKAKDDGWIAIRKPSGGYEHGCDHNCERDVRRGDLLSRHRKVTTGGRAASRQ